MRVAGPLSAIERVLVQEPNVSHVHDVGDRLQFELDGGDVEQAQLLARLVATGVPLLEFSSRSAGLEDIFMEITEGRVQ